MYVKFIAKWKKQDEQVYLVVGCRAYLVAVKSQF